MSLRPCTLSLTALVAASLLTACGGGGDDPAAGTASTAATAASAAAFSCDTSHYAAGAVALPTADELKTYFGTYDGDEGTFGPNIGDAFVKSGSATLVFSAEATMSYKGTAYKVLSVCIDKAANGTGDRFVYVEAGKGLLDVTSKGTAHGFSPADGATLFQNGVKK